MSGGLCSPIIGQNVKCGKHQTKYEISTISAAAARICLSAAAVQRNSSTLHQLNQVHEKRKKLVEVLATEL